jgi:ketosteroid isomerase-like protein
MTCVSDLALEQYLHDELADATAREHIIGCVECRAELAAKRRVGDLYMRTREARQLAQLLATTERVLVPPRRRTWRLPLALAAIATVVVIALLAGRGGGDASADVLATERAWIEALRANDAPALDAILADDYALTDDRGRRRSKADDLARARAGTLHFDVYDARDLSVRVWGDTAVVTGLGEVRGTSEGRAFASTFAFTDTFARADGRWRAVAAHVSQKRVAP